MTDANTYRVLASRDQGILPPVLLGKAIAATASDLAKELVKYALPASAGLLIVTPSTAVFGVAVEMLVGRLFEQNQALHDEFKAKVDTVLAEPLKTACKQLTDIARIKTTDEQTLGQIDRQLDVVYDTLIKALSYAEENDRESRLTITAYLALAAALMKGGKEFAQLHISSLREEAVRIRVECERFAQDYAWLVKLADEYGEKMRLSDSFDDFWDGPGVSPRQRLTGVYARTATGYRSEAEQCQRMLHAIKDVPGDIETFCEFLKPILADRLSVFRP